MPYTCCFMHVHLFKKMLWPAVNSLGSNFSLLHIFYLSLILCRDVGEVSKHCLSHTLSLTHTHKHALLRLANLLPCTMGEETPLTLSTARGHFNLPAYNISVRSSPSWLVAKGRYGIQVVTSPNQLEIPFSPWGMWSGHLRSAREYNDNEMKRLLTLNICYYCFPFLNEGLLCCLLVSLVEKLQAEQQLPNVNKC